MGSVLSVPSPPVNESHTFTSKPDEVPQSSPRSPNDKEERICSSFPFVVEQNGIMKLGQNLATFGIKLSIC